MSRGTWSSDDEDPIIGEPEVRVFGKHMLHNAPGCRLKRSRGLVVSLSGKVIVPPGFFRTTPRKSLWDAALL